jgi:hypothetical protein
MHGDPELLANDEGGWNATKCKKHYNYERPYEESMRERRRLQLLSEAPRGDEGSGMEEVD